MHREIVYKDIGGTSGKAYGIFTSGTTAKLYTVNLATTAAVADFASGLGF